MAGAGPVSESLPVMAVPPMLVEGGRFLKWDDQDASCTAHILEVDTKGHILFWKPEDYSKDTDVLDLVLVRDVRTGLYAKSPKTQDARMRETLKTFCAFDHERDNIQGRTITIIYGSNFVDLSFVNFVTPSVSEAEEWTKALLSCSNNLLEMNSSPLKCLERFYTRVYVQKNQDGEVPAKQLVKSFVSNKDDKKRAYETLQSVGLASSKKDTIKVKHFTFDKFLAFYNRFVTRHDLDAVFAELGAKNKPYLTTEQLVEFLNHRQRDPRLNEILFPYYNQERAQLIIATYEPNKAFANKGYISIDGLTKFLMSDDNFILLPGKLQIHHDLTFPITHYFINSSHNTYLQGHQLTGKSSVEIYRQVLIAGCRCVELDCWDGRTEDQEPVITHGMTLCTEVPFKDVIEAIAESAFKTSEYPVILSFENHCSAKQQKKMASYCVQIFGDLLLNKELDEHPLELNTPLPSPKALKRKILIKNKKRAKDAKNSSFSSQSVDSSSVPTAAEVINDGQEDGFVKEVLSKTEEEEQPEVEAQPELSELVNYFQPVHFRGFERAEKVQRYYEMSSFSENTATSLLREQPVEFVNYNKFQPSRIYPKGSRVSSDNYMPQMFWNAGCQLVALNFQTLDLPMMLNLGKFEINGRCGYLLKPEHMRRHDRTFDPFVESTVDGIIAVTVEVRVISGQCLSERKCGTYVEVEMYGLPADTVRRKYRTKVVSTNSLNPVYDEEPFKFKVILPNLAELRIAVYEDNGKLIGHRILPIDGLSPGYRHIKLRNEAYQPLCLPTLFVDITTKDFVPKSFTDFADALSNPMKYFSEQEKRSKQLEALMDFEDNTDSVFIPGPSELSVPTNLSSLKRGSIVSLQGIISQDITRDKAEMSKRDSVKKAASESVPKKAVELPPMVRSTSISLEQNRNDMLALSAPPIESLKTHKLYSKFKQKIANEMDLLAVKQAKDRAKINKELESEKKRLSVLVEKEKSVTKKRHSKLLKRAEEEGTYNETYKMCVRDINDLNDKHDEEVKRLMREQRVKVKSLYLQYYEEQLQLLKNLVQPKLLELKKILQQWEAGDRKKLQERHSSEMLMLKKDQDKFNLGEIRNISKTVKDKTDLPKMIRIQNKKHIEQSVKERQRMKEFQDKETEFLAKKYEEQAVVLGDMYDMDLKALEDLCTEKCAQLDTQDLRMLVPLLEYDDII